MSLLRRLSEWQSSSVRYCMASASILLGMAYNLGCGSSTDSQKPTDPQTNQQGSSSETSVTRLVDGSTQTAQNPVSGAGPNSQMTQVGNANGVKANGGAMLGSTKTGVAENRNLPTAQESTESWLNRQVSKAVAFRQAKNYSQENKVWSEMVQRLEKAVGAGYWVTAGARISQDLTGQLASFDREKLRSWDSFQALESRLINFKDETSNGIKTNQLNPTQRIAAVDAMISIVNQQEALVRELFGENSHLMSNLAYTKAEFLTAKGDHINGLIQAERSLNIRMVAIKVLHPDTLASYKLMAQIAQKAGKQSLAADCYVKAARQAEQVWGSDHLSFAVHANDAGVYFYSFGNSQTGVGQADFSKANYWLGRALQVRKTVLGNDQLLTALSHRNMAMAKMAEATSKPEAFQLLDLAAADSSMDQALQVIRRKSQDDPTMWVQVMTEAATIKMLRQQFGEAETLLLEALDSKIAKSNPAAMPISVPNLQVRAAVACIKQLNVAKKNQAKDLLQKAIAQFQANPSEAATEKQARAALALVTSPDFDMKIAAAKSQSLNSEAAPSPASELPPALRISSLPDLESNF